MAARIRMATAVRPSRRSASVATRERAIIRGAFAPRPRGDLVEWADTHRMLSPEANIAAAEAGVPLPYSTSTTPYVREPMLALSSRETEQVVLMFPAQDGKTEILNNFVGWRIHWFPRPILVMYPTEGMAETWSKTRLAPMLRDTPALRGKVRDARSRDSNNTILHKIFPGGSVTAVGSKSAAELSSRPMADVIVDEADRCEKSIKREGDAISLAFRRATTAGRGKRLIISSPTLKGDSRIYDEYMAGTQEEMHVPCPRCGVYQYLEWGSPDTPHGMKWDSPNSDPYYACKACSARIEEAEKPWMIARYRWVAQNPAAGPRVRSFKKSGLTASLASWRKQRDEWRQAQHHPFQLQQFVNTVLVELWDPDRDNRLSSDDLYGRLERYPAEVPGGVALLVRTTDVQDDRIETSVWGFGAGEEMWLIDFELIPGNPSAPVSRLDSPWRRHDELLAKAYRHEHGAKLLPQLTFIDSGGHATSTVYDYARSRQRLNVYATKGANVESAPLLSTPRHQAKANVVLYMIGASTAKDTIQRRLARITKPGPGYIHLPKKEWLDRPRVEQFTNELRRPKIVDGRVKRPWVQSGPNEMLDMAGGALAALQRFGYDRIQRLGEEAQALRREGLKASSPAPPPAPASGLLSEVEW